MIVPDWVGVIKEIAGPVSVIASYALGRAGKTAVNQSKLDEMCIRVERAEKRLDENDKTLAQHSTLHEGYIQMQKQILSVDRKLNAVCGKLGIEGTT